MRTVPLLVLCALAAGCAPASQQNETGWTVEGGAMVFTAGRGPQTELFIQYGVDTVRTNLTNTEGQDHWASWSPDGSRIAFQSMRDGNREIYVMNADGSNPQNLTSHEADDLLPSWSPDGTTIAFFSTRNEPRGPNGEFRGALYLMDTQGGNVRRATPVALSTTTEAGWAPDGTRFCFSRNGNLHVLDVASGTEKPLTDGESFDGSPAWSPDGSEIAFYSQRGESSVIVVMQADGSGARDVTDEPGQSYYPLWSPDGDLITFTVLIGEQYDIRAIDLGTGEAFDLVATPDMEVRGVWAPDRRSVR